MGKLLMSAVAVAMIAVSAFADEKHWTGGAGTTDFFTAQNWSDKSGDVVDEAPGELDDVVIAAPVGSAVTVVVDRVISVQSLTVGSTAEGVGESRLEMRHADINEVGGDLIVLANGVLTHTQATSATVTYALKFRVGGDAEVQSGGVIDVKGKGCRGESTGQGGAGGCNGASHGGLSPNHASSGSYGKVYDSILAPSQYGSGGGYSGYCSGGVVYLEIDGRLTINGTVTAAPSMGDASAGSIHLDVGYLEGAGFILANGDKANWRPAGGGRIAIYQRKTSGWDAFTGAIGASGLRSGLGNSGAGTIYLEDQDDDGHGDLIIDNSNIDSGTDEYGVTPITTAIDGHDHVFGNVIVRRKAKLQLCEGVTLKVTKGFDLADGAMRTATLGSLELHPEENGTVCLGGAITVKSLVCDQPGATVLFSDATSVAIADAGTISLTGDAESQLNLLPATQEGTWSFSLGAGAQSVIQYAAVSNSTVNVIVADEGGTDLGGNSDTWSFPQPSHPGDPIVWAGVADADWSNAANWNPQRAPKATDAITIPDGCDNYPTIAVSFSSDYSLSIATGASLRLSPGVDLPVSGDLTCCGAIISDDLGAVRLVGDTAQTVNLGGATCPWISVEKTGGSVSFAGDFTVERLTCAASAAVNLFFEAQSLVTVDVLDLQGLVRQQGSDDIHLIRLASSKAGTSWNLKVVRAACVRGVMVSDCDAGAGLTIRAGLLSSADGNVENWDFSEAAALNWVGGDAVKSTKLLVAGNWYPAVAPTETSHLLLCAGAGEAFAAEVAAADTNVVSVESISVGGGAGTVSLSSTVPLSLVRELEVGSGATVTLTSQGAASTAGNLFVRCGGTLTHAQGGKNILALEVADKAVVETDGAISASSCGYNFRAGPGADGASPSHGGMGSDNAAKCYGSIFTPTNCGSGGLYEGSGTLRPSLGGGAVNLKVEGDLVLHGKIECDGCDATSFGAAGGSVWLRTGRLLGNGMVYARGTRTAAGGRIAIYQSQVTESENGFTGIASAASASASVGAGTVYRQYAGQSEHGGEIFVESEGETGKTAFPASGDSGSPRRAYRFATLKVSRGTIRLYAPNWDFEANPLRFRDLELTGTKAKIADKTIRVSSYAHRDGKGWADTYQNLVETPGGKVEWVAPGFVVQLR